ncbi:EGF-like and EMI domain-containing protein 1 [Macrotis lagotis]|uniref:EGF-like and EMI domain-containing protein 1 n=1 Tax=Macrotis lagotis TaxID=92651 RepID=UPI003D685BBE
MGSESQMHLRTCANSLAGRETRQIQRHGLKPAGDTAIIVEFCSLAPPRRYLTSEDHIDGLWNGKVRTCPVSFATADNTMLFTPGGKRAWRPQRPNVCEEEVLAVISRPQPCVQPFTRMVKLWKQGCTGPRWCMGFARRTGYHTVYRQVYTRQHQTVYRCCPGWSRLEDEPGCLHALCSAGPCFNGGQCPDGEAQMCQCSVGFQGPRCQYGEWTIPTLFMLKTWLVLAIQKMTDFVDSDR